ncbi:MAG: hypothetical protein NC293_01445 [Roseburia sp.]|nr:hypothetical protein [Roseburia sp.]
MKQKDPETSFITKYFVKTPIFFCLLLAVGVIIFVLLSVNIKVPIYKTYAGTVQNPKDITIIQTKEILPESDDAILLYSNRDSHIEKVSDYDMADYMISMRNQCEVFSDHEAISVDVVQEEVSLFELVFKNGGISE